MSFTNDVLEWPVQDLPHHRSEAIKRDVDGRIRRAARQRRGVGAGVVASGGLLVLGVVSGVLGGPAEKAEAAWSAVPRPLSIGLDDPMVAGCRESLGDSGAASSADLRALGISVAERRGASRAVLLTSGPQQAVCIWTPSSRTGGTTTSDTLGPGQSVSVAGNGGSSDPDGDVRYVYGRVRPGVTSVQVTTDDRTVVEASVTKGEYLAWWPAAAGGVQQVSAMDGSRDVLQTIAPE